MSISEPFIRRPIGTSLLMLGVLVFGIGAYNLLPVAALPKDLPNPPIYRKTNPADRPVLIYAVHSDALPVYRIDDYAYTIIAQKISTVKGVSESRIFGQKPYAVHVQVNPAALASRGIGLEEVRTALTTATVNRPKGVLEGAHRAVTLDTNDQLFNADGFRKVIVAWRNGAPVRPASPGHPGSSGTGPRRRPSRRVPDPCR